MNRIRKWQCKSLLKRIEKYERFIARCKQWRKQSIKEFNYQVLKLTPIEFVELSGETGYLSEKQHIVILKKIIDKIKK